MAKQQTVNQVTAFFNETLQT